MIKLATRVNSLKSSSIMELSARAQEMKSQGIDVITLAAGEPDFNTPEVIQQAATQAMKEGITRYTPAPGFTALREAIAQMVTRENKFPVSAEEVVVTSGAKHALYLTLQCLCDPGEAVLVPTPAWVSYTPMIELTGASIIPLPLHEEDGYRPNVDRWKGMAIPPNAKGILLNSPNNPAGVVYTKEDLTRVVSWAMQRGLWIISDEIYEKILYDGAVHTSTAALGPEAKASTITISGFSKSYAMTGWRFGWAIANKEIISKVSALQSQSNSHVTSFVQSAALKATTLPASVVNDMVREFTKRRDYVMSRLDKLSDYCTYARPTGAFYFFINFTKFLAPRKMTDSEFSKELLMKAHVCVVPGGAFGKENAIRISYATSLKNLEVAMDRIEKYLRG